MPTKPGQTVGKRKSTVQKDDEARLVYQMRLDGLRTDQIARELGIAVGTVQLRYNRGAELVLSPGVEEFRARSQARLDGTLMALLKDNQTMTPRVAEVIVKLEERGAKLWGADAPVVVEQTVTVIEGGIDAEVAKLAAELGLSTGVEAVEQTIEVEA